MEESESSMLPVIILAVFLLIIIGIVVWLIMTRRAIGPPVNPIPVAPLPPNNTPSSVANPPASVPVVNISRRKKKHREESRDDHREESCSKEESKNDSSHSAGEFSSHSEGNSSHSTEDSSRSRGEARIQVYSYSLEQEEDICLPCDDICSIAHSAGELYACTSSSIYVWEEQEWNLVGSLEEETIQEAFDDNGRLRVRTTSGDYMLNRSGDKIKMNSCRKKERKYQGEEVSLNGSTLILDWKSIKNVDCFCTDGESLAYVSSGSLHLLEGKKNKKIDGNVIATCMNDNNIYLLVE